ncbi:MAG: hypothetical protein QOD84_1093 [Acidobacteriaceae bacterium]|jgi:hypothetical protein
MRSANARQPSRDNFSAFGHELCQQAHVFVIDCFDLLDAELANFLAAEKFTAALAASAGSTWARRTSFSAELPVTRRTVSKRRPIS